MSSVRNVGWRVFRGEDSFASGVSGGRCGCPVGLNVDAVCACEDTRTRPRARTHTHTYTHTHTNAHTHAHTHTNTHTHTHTLTRTHTQSFIARVRTRAHLFSTCVFPYARPIRHMLFPYAQACEFAELNASDVSPALLLTRFLAYARAHSAYAFPVWAAPFHVRISRMQAPPPRGAARRRGGVARPARVHAGGAPRKVRAAKARAYFTRAALAGSARTGSTPPRSPSGPRRRRPP